MNVLCFQKCKRTLLVTLPEKNQEKGKKPKNLFPFGNIDLTKKFPTETKWCPPKAKLKH